MVRTLVFVTFTIKVSTVGADAPLPPPATVSAMSPGGHIRAVSDPKTGTRVEDAEQDTLLWSVPGWYRSLFVADDGKHLVTQYDGLNLLPADFTDDLVLLTFWREGKKLRDVRVGDLLPDHRILQRTASHYRWGIVHGIDAQGRLKVERADRKIFFFDVSTGRIIDA